MSLSTARVRPQTVQVSPAISANLVRRDLKSPGLEMGKPASMTSDVHAHELARNDELLLGVHGLAPGDCSPSRRVVSKIAILRVMVPPVHRSRRATMFNMSGFVGTYR